MIDKLAYLLAQAPTPDDVGLPEIDADESQLQSLFAVIFGIAAAIAVLVIVLASINFITGGGDPDKISRAKKSVIFALVGLAIAISGEVIVLTVLDRL
jgi:hypothetical protein